MKTYRIYLKSGATFTIEAAKFELDAVGSLTFYADNGQPDKEIFVRAEEVAAIKPVTERGKLLNFRQTEVILEGLALFDFHSHFVFIVEDKLHCAASVFLLNHPRHSKPFYVY
jgi:hypothetical protein